MKRLSRTLFAVFVACGLCLAGFAPQAAAQPVATTTYVPAPPILTYFPERRGLFGQRTVYRPVVTYAAPTPPPIITEPASPATVYYTPPRAVAVSPEPVVTAGPVVVAPAPIVRRPAGSILVAPPPVIVAQPVPPVVVAPRVVVP